MAQESIKQTSNDKEKSEGEGNVLAGFVLYKDANMDWQRLKKILKEDWDIEFDDQVKDNALVFKWDDMVVACSLMPNPVPNDEAVGAAKRNILWKDGADVVKTHGAHVMLAVMNKFDPLDQQELFAKVACSLLKLDNAIGIYKDPTVYEKDFYINFAMSIDKGDYPIPIYVYVGMYVENGGVYAFTSGMRFFGKQEMEILGSSYEPDEVLSFMYTICEYVIVEDIELKDGETIGFSEDQKLPIKLSEGVSVPGETLKITL
ncbi:MAG: DUF4261 domain-containing protein [Ruminococcus sp.]|nr:DUF4261 domain-containing protein [Ruminococcus sp.]